MQHKWTCLPAKAAQTSQFAVHRRLRRLPRAKSSIGSSRPPIGDRSSGSGGSTDSNCSSNRRALLTGLVGSAASTVAAPAQCAAAAAIDISQQAPAPPAPGAGAASCSEAGGVAALRDPAVNQGLATPAAVRQQLQLSGLLPPRQVELQVEVERGRAALSACSTPLEKHRLLITLKETNQAAFFALLHADLAQLLPLVYTPVIGDACLAWGSLVPRPTGLYVTLADRGRVRELLQQWPSREVRIAVITDGERILGLGDLGASGMGIPTGKCTVYAAAGVPPEWLMPVMVDVGTNNPQQLADALYVGVPQLRVRGEQYVALMRELVGALQQYWGRPVLVHWEDLAVHNAFKMLQMARAMLAPTYNDDIQATAAVALAAILGAARLPGVLPLQQQRWLFFGAGQANLGTAQLLVQALQQQGVSAAAARASIWMVDSKGLILASRQGLTPEKQQFAQDASRLRVQDHGVPGQEGSSGAAQQLAHTIEAVQPTALVGAAAVAGAFNQAVVEALVQSASSAHTRPLLLALSNPTSKAEVSFEDAWRWSQGRVVYASGSPFPALAVPASAAAARAPGSRAVLAQHTLTPGQANNCLCFPGLSLGVINSGAAAITDDLLLAAAQAVAGSVNQDELLHESVLPRVARLQQVTQVVAAAVAAAAAAVR